MIPSRIFKVFLLSFLAIALLNVGNTSYAKAKKAHSVEPEVPAQAKGNQTQADQQILEFNMSGFGEKSKKTWDIKGSSADILADIVKLYNINANFYGESESMNLKADEGYYDKNKNFIHLEKNVVATTQTGSKVTTNSLDWDREKKYITSKDIVNIKKENILATGTGLETNIDVKKASLKEAVTVIIKAATPDKPDTIITCDGPLNIDYENQTAVFNKNVKVDDKGGRGLLYSDRLEITFDYATKQINKIIATERPRLFIYQAEELGSLVNAPSGN